MSEHTPEPWITVRNNGIPPVLLRDIQHELRIVFAVQDSQDFDVAFVPPTDGDHGNANATRIVECVNGCLGIVDPKTTVPELVEACKASARYFTACGTAWAANDGILVSVRQSEADCRPIVQAEGLDELCDIACESVFAVLAKMKGGGA